MAATKTLYRYSGPVMQFDRLVCSKWTAETYASTRAKAKSNLCYRFKKEAGLAASSRCSIVDKYLYETGITESEW